MCLSVLCYLANGLFPHFLYVLLPLWLAGILCLCLLLPRVLCFRLSCLYFLPGYWPVSFLLTHVSNTYSQSTEGLFHSSSYLNSCLNFLQRWTVICERKPNKPSVPWIVLGLTASTGMKLERTLMLSTYMSHLCTSMTSVSFSYYADSVDWLL